MPTIPYNPGLNTNNPATYFPASDHPIFLSDIMARMLGMTGRGYTGTNGMYMNPNGTISWDEGPNGGYKPPVNPGTGPGNVATDPGNSGAPVQGGDLNNTGVPAPYTSPGATDPGNQYNPVPGGSAGGNNLFSLATGRNLTYNRNNPNPADTNGGTSNNPGGVYPGSPGGMPNPNTGIPSPNTPAGNPNLGAGGNYIYGSGGTNSGYGGLNTDMFDPNDYSNLQSMSQMMGNRLGLRSSFGMTGGMFAKRSPQGYQGY